MKTVLIFIAGLSCLTTLALPTPPCERAWQNPAQRARDRFSYHISQVKENHITVDISSAHLKKVENKEPSSLYPNFKLRLYKGEKVALKPITQAFKSKRPLMQNEVSESLRELAVYRTLQQLGIPTLFKGVTMLPHTKEDIADTTRLTWPREEMSPFISGDNLLLPTNMAQVNKQNRAMGRADPTLSGNGPPSNQKSPFTEPRYFMVLKFQEGEVLHLDKTTHIDWIMNRNSYLINQTAEDLKNIKALFVKYLILPRDFQVLLSADGRMYIFDVEYYEFLGTGTKGQQSEYAKYIDGGFKTEEERLHTINLYFEDLGFPDYFKAFMD